MQRRSFAAASFLEEDTVDFPDELDTSFFAKVKLQNLAFTAHTTSMLPPSVGICKDH